MQGLLRFARTAAGISAVQLWFQVWRRAQGSARPRVIDSTPAADKFWREFAELLRTSPPPPNWDGDEIAAEAMLGKWTILGETYVIDPQLNWGRRVGRPLQSFHLQYHEPLRALARYADRSRDPRALSAIAGVVMRWIETTSTGGGDAWHPYPISVRVFVWFEVLALVGSLLPSRVQVAMRASLASQLDVLARRRERQIGGNHLQRNDAALALGGIGFTGTHAARWRSVGLAGTWSALRHHVLDDGMHFERSPMYHAGMLADVLRVMECCTLTGVAVPDFARERAGQMASALKRMTREDGSLHQFNDTAAEIAPPTSWLVERASQEARVERAAEGRGAWMLRDAGYAGWHDPQTGTRIVIDAGAPGPREQPGHAQCDALSFELCVNGFPVLVNAGVHGYDQDPYREYSRSVRGHNTVQVGNREQHEVWATFRVARFGVVEGPFVHSVDPWSVSGRVVGYAGGTHSRRLEMLTDTSIRVTDTIAGDDGEFACARFLLHPSFEVTIEGDVLVARQAKLVVRLASDPARPVRLVRGTAAPAEGWYFPTFGRAQAATCFVRDTVLPTGPLVTTISWGTG